MKNYIPEVLVFSKGTINYNEIVDFLKGVILNSSPTALSYSNNKVIKDIFNKSIRSVNYNPITVRLLLQAFMDKGLLQPRFKIEGSRSALIVPENISIEINQINKSPVIEKDLVAYSKEVVTKVSSNEKVVKSVDNVKIKKSKNQKDNSEKDFIVW